MREANNLYVFCKFHNELDYICEKLGYVSVFNKRTNEFNLVLKSELHDRIYIREYDALPTDVKTAWRKSFSYVRLLNYSLEWLENETATSMYGEAHDYSQMLETVRKYLEQEVKREMANITLLNVQRDGEQAKVVFTYAKSNQMYLKYVSIDKAENDEAIKTYLAKNVDDYYRNPSILYIPKWLQLIIKQTYDNGSISIPTEQLMQYGVDKKTFKQICCDYDVENCFEVYEDEVEVDGKLPEYFELFGIEGVK